MAVGPVLKQAELLAATSSSAIVSAYETIYDPTSLYVARLSADGTLQWRKEASSLGLEEGRARRADRVPGTTDLIVVLTGVARERSWFDRLTFATHAVAVRLDVESGEIRWMSVF